MSESKIFAALKEALENTSNSDPQTDEELTEFLENASQINLPELPESLEKEEILKRIKQEDSLPVFKVPTTDEDPSSATEGLALAARNGEGKLPEEVLEKMRKNKAKKQNKDEE